jgi:hypothetical protein
LHIKVKKGGYGRAAVFDRVNFIEKTPALQVLLYLKTTISNTKEKNDG